MANNIKVKVRAASAVYAYCFVKNSSGDVATAAENGADAIGVVQQDLATGEVGDMVISGQTLLKIEAHGSIVPGSPLTVDGTNGQAKLAASGHFPLAQYAPSTNAGGAASNPAAGDLVNVIVNIGRVALA